MACVPVPRVEIAICAFSMCRRGTGAGLRNVGAFSAAFDLGSRPASRGCRGVFRREYAGAARPRLRQRVFDSLDSLQGLAE